MALTKVSRGLLSTSIVDNGNATAITIDANENVGIGTSSPDVFSRGYTGTITGISSASGETALMLNSSGTNVTALEMGRAGTRELLLYDTPTASQLFSLTSKPLAFGTAGAERMRIDSSGELTLGNPSGGSALQLDVSATGSDGVDIKGTYYTGSYGPIKFHAGGSERMRIDSSGNLLVGDTSSSFPTNVRAFKVFQASIAISHNTSNTSGDSYVRFGYSTNTIGSITQNGTTAVLYNTSSDQRLKENIVDAPSASDDIDAIQVRSFDWKADGSHQKYGMIAQELNTVAPVAVSVPEDPEEMMGVDYSKLVPMLIKEIQSLRARVQQLEN